MVIEPGPDCTVGPENPWTVQIHGLFKVRNRSIPKKHGTVRPAVRPSGSVNHDRFGRFGRFGLFQSLNDVVHFLFFFFFSLNGVVLIQLQRFLFCPSYTASFFVLSLSQSFWNPFSFYSSLPSLKVSETASHSQKSLSNPRAVALHSPVVAVALHSSLAPSHFTAPSRRRTSQLPRAVALRSYLVTVAAQPRYDYVVLVDLWLHNWVVIWICCGWA